MRPMITPALLGRNEKTTAVSITIVHEEALPILFGDWTSLPRLMKSPPASS